MINILNPYLTSHLHGIFYRSRFLINYIIIGFISIIIELLIQNKLIDLNFNIYFATLISISIGISFAFFGNIFFNFKIPLQKRNQAFKYFTLISLFSGFLQWFAVSNIDTLEWTYEGGRIFISGSMFMIGYLLHRKFSFRDRKKVGVAIYANGVEDVAQIHTTIGSYLDFIHVDIVDSTMNPNAEEVNTYRMETIKAYWPNKQIHTHIMSKTPSRYISEILLFSDITFIHPEYCEDIYDLYSTIKKAGKKFGLAFLFTTDIKKFESIIKLADNILLLSIKNPGLSGQEFQLKSLEKINFLNKHQYRNQFSLCIDGGVNEDIVSLLKAEDIVSGSSVLNNENPKKQIMRLQTASRYGAF